MGGDISFSGTEIALITAMLGAVVGALGIVFRALLAAKQEHIASLELQLKIAHADAEDWKRGAFESTGIAAGAVDVAKVRTGAR